MSETITTRYEYDELFGACRFLSRRLRCGRTRFDRDGQTIGFTSENSGLVATMDNGVITVPSIDKTYTLEEIKYENSEAVRIGKTNQASQNIREQARKLMEQYSPLDDAEYDNTAHPNVFQIKLDSISKYEDCEEVRILHDAKDAEFAFMIDGKQTFCELDDAVSHAKAGVPYIGYRPKGEAGISTESAESIARALGEFQATESMSENKSMTYDIKDLFAVCRFLSRRRKCGRVRFARDDEIIGFISEYDGLIATLQNGIITVFAIDKKYGLKTVAYENDEVASQGKEKRTRQQPRRVRTAEESQIWADAGKQATQLVKQYGPLNDDEFEKIRYPDVFRIQADSISKYEDCEQVTILPDACNAEFVFLVGENRVFCELEDAVKHAKVGAHYIGYRPIGETAISSEYAVSIVRALLEYESTVPVTEMGDAIQYEKDDLLAACRFLSRRLKCGRVIFERNSSIMEFISEYDGLVATLQNGITTVLASGEKHAFKDIAYHNDQAVKIGKAIQAKKDAEKLASDSTKTLPASEFAGCKTQSQMKEKYGMKSVLPVGADAGKVAETGANSADTIKCATPSKSPI